MGEAAELAEIIDAEGPAVTPCRLVDDRGDGVGCRVPTLAMKLRTGGQLGEDLPARDGQVDSPRQAAANVTWRASTKRRTQATRLFPRASFARQTSAPAERASCRAECPFIDIDCMMMIGRRAGG